MPDDVAILILYGLCFLFVLAFVYMMLKVK